MESYDRNYPHHYVYVRTDLDALRRVDAAKAQLILDAADDYAATLIGIVAEGQAAGQFHRAASADVLTFAVLGMVNWTHQWYRPGGRYSAAQLGTIFGDLALRGLSGELPLAPVAPGDAAATRNRRVAAAAPAQSRPVNKATPRASTSVRNTDPAPDAAT